MCSGDPQLECDLGMLSSGVQRLGTTDLEHIRPSRLRYKDFVSASMGARTWTILQVYSRAINWRSSLSSVKMAIQVKTDRLLPFCHRGPRWGARGGGSRMRRERGP